MSKFSDLINGNQPVLVDFYADWCSPCKIMSPILKQVAEELGDKATIIKVDIDKNPKVASLYEIQGVPTFILFKNGEIKWRQSGILAEAYLVELLKQYTD